MRQQNLLLCFVIFAFLFVYNAIGQSVRGYVYSHENIPIPYAHVYVKFTDIGTTTDEQGKYFLQLEEGDYELVFSSLGYETKTVPTVVKKLDVVKNVWIKKFV